MARRIIVTGAGGFIGRHTLPKLVERGFEVVAFDYRMPDDAYRHAQWIACDLLDRDAVKAALAEARADEMLHIAWRAVVGGLWTAPENLAWLHASLDLLDAFRASGGRRVTMVGSCGEYDWASGLCREDATPTNPTTFYGACKNAIRQTAEQYCAIHKMEFAWARAFFIHGPGEHPSRLGASVALSLLRGEEALCTHGMQLRDYLHVADVADGFVAVAASDKTGAFNIGSGEAIRVRDLIMAIADAAGRPELVRLGARAAPGYEPPLIVADMEKTRRELGWKPHFTLESGAADTVAWFKARM